MLRSLRPGLRLYILNKRFISFTQEPFTNVTLSERIQKHVLEPESPDSSTVLDALKACASLETIYEESSTAASPLPQESSEKARDLFQKVLDKSDLSESLIRDLFVSSPPLSAESSTATILSFNKKHPQQTLSESTVMIPFRHAAYNGDFPGALDLLDVSAGRLSNADTVGTAKLRKIGAAWAAGTGGILFGINSLLDSGLVGQWESNGMVLSMVFTYLCAVSVYTVMSFSGTKSGANDTLQWLKGTPMSYRFKHSLEMKMAALVAEMNRNLPENQGVAATQMRIELKDRHMAPVESKEEEMLKEYWARGGEGFEWVEPDQDPADIVWQTKMDRNRQERIGSPFVRRDDYDNMHNWAQDMTHTIQKSMPHASLIDMDSLRTPEKMAQLEEDIRKLKAQDAALAAQESPSQISDGNKDAEKPQK